MLRGFTALQLQGSSFCPRPTGFLFQVTDVLTNGFSLKNDHTALLFQGSEKLKTCPTGFPANSRPAQDDSIRNSYGYSDNRTINESSGKRNVTPQAQKNDFFVPMSAEARLFSADEYIGTSIVSDISSSEGNTLPVQIKTKNKGKDLFNCDWAELAGLEDFDADPRNIDSTFDIGSNYFDVPIWSPICSPDVQLVPSSYQVDNPKLSTVSNQSTANQMLKPSVSVPDNDITEPELLDQIDMEDLMNIMQPSRHEEREKLLNCEAHACSSSREMEHFSEHSDADLSCPFDNLTSTARIGNCEGLEAIVFSDQEMLVPTASSIMWNDEIASSSSICPGLDLVAENAPNSTKSHDPLHATPDMILDGMAENPLDQYFPPLTTYEQPELLMNNTSTPEHFAGDNVLNSTGLQFCSKERASAELSDNPCSSLILEAVPVKDLGFKRLQEGMNQLDVVTKTYIRDALYRLAHNVEQRHCVKQRTGGAVESSSANRYSSSRWTDIQASPMDRSVAQLLLQKPLY